MKLQYSHRLLFMTICDSIVNTFFLLQRSSTCPQCRRKCEWRKSKRIYFNFVDENEDRITEKELETVCADLQKENASMQASLDQYKQINIGLEKRNTSIKASRDRYKQISLDLNASLDEYKKLNLDLEQKNSSIKASRDRHKQISLDLERQNNKCKFSFDLYKRHIQQRYENGRNDVAQLKEQLAQLKDANKAAVEELQQSSDKCSDSKHKIKSLKNTINELQLEREELIDALQSQFSAEKNQHTADMANTINNHRIELLFCQKKLQRTIAQLKKMEDETRQSERESTQTTIVMEQSVSNGENQATKGRKRKAITETNSTDNNWEPISCRTRTKMRKTNNTSDGVGRLQK